MEAKLPEVQKQPPPKQPDNVVPMSGVERANTMQPPDHYLKGPEEPWRPFVGVDGPVARRF